MFCLTLWLYNIRHRWRNYVNSVNILLIHLKHIVNDSYRPSWLGHTLDSPDVIFYHKYDRRSLSFIFIFLYTKGFLCPVIIVLPEAVVLPAVVLLKIIMLREPVLPPLRTAANAAAVPAALSEKWFSLRWSCPCFNCFLCIHFSRQPETKMECPYIFPTLPLMYLLLLRTISPPVCTRWKPSRSSP